MDREGAPTTAIEPPPGLEREPLGFAAGVAVGVTVSIIGMQVWLAVYLAPWRDIVRDFGGELRNLSALALSPEWRYGVPLGTAILLAAAFTTGARRVWIYAVVAALALAALGLTYLWASAPFDQLAGRLSD